MKMHCSDQFTSMLRWWPASHPRILYTIVLHAHSSTSKLQPVQDRGRGRQSPLQPLSPHQPEIAIIAFLSLAEPKLHGSQLSLLCYIAFPFRRQTVFLVLGNKPSLSLSVKPACCRFRKSSSSSSSPGPASEPPLQGARRVV